MAPLSQRPVSSPTPPPPQAAVDFLLFLHRAEKALAAAGDADGGRAEDCAQIWEAKAQAYDKALRSYLADWTSLSKEAAEGYRSRIEELVPAVRKSFARQRSSPEQLAVESAAAESLTAGTTECGNSHPEAPGDVFESHGAVTPSPPPAQPPHPHTPTAADAFSPDRSSAFAGGANQATPEVAPAAGGLQWRRHPAGRTQEGGRRSAVDRAGDKANASKQLQEEMANMSEQMKDVAASMGMNLKKDNAHIEAISSSLDQSVSNVKGHTETGRKLLRSNKLGFICTMVLLVISIVVFFMMIPFIIFT